MALGLNTAEAKVPKITSEPATAGSAVDDVVSSRPLEQRLRCPWWVVDRYRGSD